MTPDRVAGSSFPRLRSPERTRVLVLLVLTGLGQVAAAALTTVALVVGLDPARASSAWLLIGVLLGAAVGIGWLRARERILAERIGQDYVHQIRDLLVARMLGSQRPGSLGIALTRASNDLTAVRNWVALGVAPLVTGVPVLLGVATVLTFLDPWLLPALLVPMVVLALVLAWAGVRTYDASRTLRRERGRLAGRLADVAIARRSIREGGGEERERRRIRQRSDRVVAASLARARSAAVLRGVAAAAAAVVVPAILAVALARGLPAATVAGAISVVGLLATTVTDLGRVVEYRQGFRAARVVLERNLNATDAAPLPAPAAEGDEGSGTPDLAVHDLHVALPSGRVVDIPDLHVHGPSLVEVSGPRQVVDAVLAVVSGSDAPVAGEVRVDGRSVHRMPNRERRERVGAAVRGQPLPRGSIRRTVTYRTPDVDEAELDAVLHLVDAHQRVEALPDGRDTQLRRGGTELDDVTLHRVRAARALIGDPSLLLVDALGDIVHDDPGHPLAKTLNDRTGVTVLAGGCAGVEAGYTWHLPD